MVFERRPDWKERVKKTTDQINKKFHESIKYQDKNLSRNERIQNIFEHSLELVQDWTGLKLSLIEQVKLRGVYCPLCLELTDNGEKVNADSEAAFLFMYYEYDLPADLEDLRKVRYGTSSDIIAYQEAQSGEERDKIRKMLHKLHYNKNPKKFEAHMKIKQKEAHWSYLD